MDEILIYSPSEEEHDKHLRIILELLRLHKLYAKFEKCEFCLSKVKFLGHVVLEEGVTIDSSKVNFIQAWERPKNLFEIRSFLGLARYYCRFVKDFSRLTTPLTRLTRKGVKIVWNETCEKSFQELKARLTTAPVLIISEWDLGYTEYCDAS
ncbi:uncharacterized protein LOC114313897 [Camellia sinensis]|uniref:uncharacterized protein LOC114313897 n=1 Tax=Camellia sinensis TaxID=4442 RepID=UPI0010368386|nr:uncharacterized protein LOC114313897 [Camellia sinensis]